MVSFHSIAALALATVATTTRTAHAQTTATLFDLIEENFETSILEALLVATGLDEAARGPGPYTIFAPQDDGFYEFFNSDPELAAAFQMDMPSWMLHITDMLLFHVVPGRNLVQGRNDMAPFPVPTLNGADITLQVDVQDRSFVVRPAATGDDGTAQGLAVMAVSNGDVNFIDKLLAPTWLKASIVDVAVGLQPEFSTLVQF